jgi:hypothetical protein
MVRNVTGFTKTQLPPLNGLVVRDGEKSNKIDETDLPRIPNIPTALVQPPTVNRVTQSDTNPTVEQGQKFAQSVLRQENLAKQQGLFPDSFQKIPAESPDTALRLLVGSVIVGTIIVAIWKVNTRNL